MARRAMRLIGSDRQRVYCVYGPEEDPALLPEFMKGFVI